MDHHNGALIPANGKKRSMFTIIFVTEIFERFSFNGLYALLGSYIASNYGTEGQAIAFVTTFAALASLNTFIGGYIADKWIGVKRALLVGAFTLLAGYALMAITYLAVSKNIFSGNLCAIPFPMLVVIFALLAVGNGIFKPATATVSALIYQGSKRLQSILTLYYIAVNIGSLVGIIVASNFSALAFLICPMTFFISFTYMMLNYHLLKIKNAADNLDINSFIVFMVTAILSLASAILLLKYSWSYRFILISFFAAFIWVINKTASIRSDSQRFIQYVGILLLCETIFFAIGFNTHINLFPFFAQRHTDLQLLGFSVKKTVYAACNPLWITVLGPIACWLFQNKLRSFPISYLYSIGTIIMGTAFLLLSAVSYHHIHSINPISGNWLFVAHGIMAIAELAINTVVLTVIVRFFVGDLTTSALGLCSVIHSLGAAATSKFSDGVSSLSVSKETSLQLYQIYFYNTALLFILFGIVFLAIAILIEQRLNKMSFYKEV